MGKLQPILGHYFANIFMSAVHKTMTAYITAIINTGNSGPSRLHYFFAVFLCTIESKPNEQLLYATEEGWLEKVENILECHLTDINTQDDDGRTPLYLAAFKNQTDVVNFLLRQESVDVNHGTQFHGETALIVGSKHGYSDIVRLLLGIENIDVNKGLTDTGLTALIAASMNGHYQIVESLLDHNLIMVNIGLLTTGENSLLAAIRNKHEDVVKLLLRNSEVDVNLGLKNGKSPLIVASSRFDSSISIVKSLLSKPGIDANKAVFNGQTALIFAVKTGNYEIVELLLRCPQIDTDLVDEEYKTAKDYAIENGFADIIQAFETRGSLTKVNGHSCCSDNINRGLLTAVEDGDLTWLTTFLTCPQIDINLGNQFGITPLILAAREGYTDIARLLLSNPDIDTNRYNSVNGKTALIEASEEGKLEVIKMLLSNAQIDVQWFDIKRETALKKAVNVANLMAVKLLLRCAKTKVDDIASSFNHINEALALRTILQEVGGTCCFNVADGLHHAAIEGHYREIRGLLQCPDSDSNVVDKKGRTPLYLAAWKGHAMAVDVLLGHQLIDTSKGTTLDGGTPFSISSEKRHLRVMQKLVSHEHKGDLNKGWCNDNWTPHLVKCRDSKDNEMKTTAETTFKTCE